MTYQKCCAVCKHCHKLIKYDYSQGGCIHSDVPGYACYIPEDGEEIIWMSGVDTYTGICENFDPKDDSDCV